MDTFSYHFDTLYVSVSILNIVSVKNVEKRFNNTR